MADLEGKLRELRNTMVNWTHCTPTFATNVVTEAAALGRVEGLEEAAKICDDVHIGSHESPNTRLADRHTLARAIRALKQ